MLSLFLQVLVRKDEGDLMGKMVEVVITETGKHFLKGKVLKENPVHTPSIAPPFAKGVVSGVKEVCCEIIIVPAFILLRTRCDVSVIGEVVKMIYKLDI